MPAQTHCREVVSLQTPEQLGFSPTKWKLRLDSEYFCSEEKPSEGLVCELHVARPEKTPQFWKGRGGWGGGERGRREEGGEGVRWEWGGKDKSGREGEERGGRAAGEGDAVSLPPALPAVLVTMRPPTALLGGGGCASLAPGGPYCNAPSGRGPGGLLLAPR